VTGDIFQFKTACASDTLANGLTLLGVVISSQMNDLEPLSAQAA